MLNLCQWHWYENKVKILVPYHLIQLGVMGENYKGFVDTSKIKSFNEE